MKKQSKTASKKTTKTTTKAKVVAAPTIKKEYAGAPIQALTVFKKTLDGFGKKQGNQCLAESWLMIGRTTYTFANTYNGILPPSYDAAHYTYELTPKAERKLTKKQAEMQEVEVADWPEWITNARRRASVKVGK